jgi:DNA repair ATPase RecN
MSGFKRLAEQVEEFPDLSSSVVVLWSATNMYVDGMGTTIGDLQNLFGGLEIYSNMNDLKSEYTTLRSWLGTTDSLQEVSLDKSDTLEKTDELGKYLFNLPTRINKSEIPIEQAELLEEIDDLIEDDANQLAKFNSKADKIDNLAREANTSAQEIIKMLIVFADRTADLEDNV